jgi:hypothetical protein
MNFLNYFYILSVITLFIFTSVILLGNKLKQYMNTKQAIRKIRIMLGAEAFEMQKTLVDGTTVVSVETEFEPGVQLSVVTPDGLVPAPEGTHTTTDGFTVVVDAAGVILEVTNTPVDLQEEEKEKEEMEEEGKKEDEEMKDKSKKKMEEAEELIVAQIIEAIAPLIEEVVEMKKDMEDFKKKFNAFSAEPAGQPIKNNFSNTESSLDKRIAVLNQIRKTNKTK